MKKPFSNSGIRACQSALLLGVLGVAQACALATPARSEGHEWDAGIICPAPLDGNPGSGIFVDGIEVGFSSRLSHRLDLRIFISDRDAGYIPDIPGDRLGGGLGFREYFRPSRNYSGPFMDEWVAAYHHSVPVPGLNTYSFTSWGPGVGVGWDFPVSRHWRLTPSLGLDCLFPDLKDRADQVVTDYQNYRIEANLKLGLAYQY
jgi:hypothetical protein